MAKNMQNTGFRKLDVDKYADDCYQDDADADTPGVGPDEREVSGLLQQNRLVDALQAALRNPPLKCRDQTQKDRATQLVTRVLTAFKQADVDGALQTLEREQLDVLMKYIYKGFEFPADGGCASLLAWHERVYELAGAGCIVRVLADRKRL